MINLLLGAPGGGKSYEATVYHIIPALAEGRLVITNLPLQLEEFPPEQRRLIHIVQPKVAFQVVANSDIDEAPKRPRFAVIDDDVAVIHRRPFGSIRDYGNEWRHPETGTGPLYVIDECHMCLPRHGSQREVLEWFSMHRHEHADVLLITQSYGKVNRDIVDLVQVVYKVRKATAFGSNSRYIRKVQDGVKGDVVNTTVRKYEKKYFKFYKSHTKSSKAGQELTANDIVPIWRRWPFIGTGICFLLAVFMFSKADVNPMDAAAQKSRKIQAASVQPQSQAPHPQPQNHNQQVPMPPGGAPGKQAETKEEAPAKKHPFDGLGIHLAGKLVNQSKGTFHLFHISQNGQSAFMLNESEMIEAGYKVKPLSACAVLLEFEGIKPIYAVCDAPRIMMSPGSNVPSSSSVSVNKG